MKHIFLTLVFVMCHISVSMASDNNFFDNFSANSFKNWSNSHWGGQNFEPSIQKNSEELRTSLDRKNSLFANVGGISPQIFIDNLKSANIIKSVYNRREGFFQQTVTNDVVIELDYNFYALSNTDKVVVSELLAKSFNQENYILKDASTKDIVGQITSGGLHLF